MARAAKKSRQFPRSRRGAMLVLVAMMLIVLIVTVVFSIDVAYMQLTRTQLRTATDAAARAAAEALSRTQQINAARTAAKVVAGKNLVANRPLELADEDIIFGRGEFAEGSPVVFVPGGTPPNSVRVNGRRTEDSPSGSVPLFFGRMIGRSVFQPVQSATSVNLDRDIVLVVDRSGSMKYSLTTGALPAGRGGCDPPDPVESRWSALQNAVQAFIGGLDETAQLEFLGIASYAGAYQGCDLTFAESTIDAPVSGNYLAVTDVMNGYSAVAINGKTNIEAGILRGIEALTDPAVARPFAEKTMVILTDGQYNLGNHPSGAAESAASQGITVHAITFSDGADQAAMEMVANAAGGNHYHAPDAATLEQIFREIALTLPVLMTE